MLLNSPIDLTLGEIHILSYFYHWGYEECWSIPVSKRGVFVDRIRQQIKAESNGGSNSGNTPKSSYKEGNRR